MGKIAFVFPGQGAQKTGMGKDFYENSVRAREAFETASRLLGFSMEELCFEKNERLDQTEYTQAALVTVSAAILTECAARGITPDMAAGLSLGEYGALLAADVMDYPDAVRVVRRRGILMQEAVPLGQGTMAAVLGLPAEKIEEVLAAYLREQAGKDGCVVIANDNCPGQVVISGRCPDVEAVLPLLKEAGARRCVPLNVSGPFHSPLLAGAGEKLRDVLQPVTIREPRIPYVANVHAEPVTSAAEVKELLCRQVSSPVLWRQSVMRMIAEGVDTFVEIGPGTTLTSFIRKIDRGQTVLHVGSWEDMEALEKALQ
ncbi:MAG: ACP S-malonyltransferase [Lachnospiraceae bacterium]|nr:ACP S-malonyltransferase [Lachnospiraceae bacterium]